LLLREGAPGGAGGGSLQPCLPSITCGPRRRQIDTAYLQCQSILVRNTGCAKDNRTPYHLPPARNLPHPELVLRLLPELRDPPGRAQ
jgi:hypothetical protein